MSAGFRGASASQDSRFSNKEEKLLKTLKFPEELSLPVDFKKVNMDAMREWVTKRVTEMLNFEDEVVVGLAMNLMEEENVNAKLMQIQLTPFLEANTGPFMTELWKLLLSAQKTPSGVPQEFLDAKAEEARKKREQERQFDERFRESSRNSGRHSQTYQSRSRASRWDDGGGRGGSRGREDSSRGGGGYGVFVPRTVSQSRNGGSDRSYHRGREERPRQRQRDRSVSPRRNYGRDAGDESRRHHRRRSPSYDRYRGREEEGSRPQSRHNHRNRRERSLDR